MRRLLLVAMMFAFAAAPLRATTWYVNPTTGGTRFSASNPTGQCNGQSSAAYVSGTNQPCPYNDARLLWDDPFTTAAGAWVMAANDTVVFACPAAGCQISGSANSSSSGDFCWGIGVTCIPPPPPNNITWQGVNAGNCSTTLTAYNASLPIYQYQGGDPTKQAWLWGGAGAFYALSLAGASGTVMNCLHITDHSNCGVIASPAPGGASPPCSGTDFASYGLYLGTGTGAGATTLTDVTIEGMSAKGIIGPISGLWTVTRVGIGFNGQTGWDFDDGSGDASSGSVVATWLTIYGNGCGQQAYPFSTTIPITGLTCAGQSNGGQGDGIGTPVTQLPFSCNHCAALYNTQDGFDFGHTYGETMSFTNSFFYSNNGGNIKVGPNQNVTAYNNIVVSGCNRLSAALTGAPANYNGNLGDFCRAFSGNGINVQTNSTWLWDGANTQLASVSCTGTACTSSNATTGLTVGQTIIPYQGTLAADSRTVATITDSSHWTISSAYTDTPTNTFMIVVASTPASTTVVHVYHNSMAGYVNEFFDNQCQIADHRGQAQAQVDAALCPGYTWDFRDNILVGYSNPGWESGVRPVAWTEVGPSLEDYNLCYNLNSSQCVNAHDLTVSPLLTSQPVSPMTAESNLDNFNFALTGASPAKGAGVAIAGQTADYSGTAWASPPSIGAFEGASSPPAIPVGGGTVNGRIAFAGKIKETRAE